MSRIENCSSAANVVKTCRLAEMPGRAGEVSIVSRSQRWRAMVKRIETTVEFQAATEEAQHSKWADAKRPDGRYF